MSTNRLGVERGRRVRLGATGFLPWVHHLTVEATGSTSRTFDPNNPTAVGTVRDGAAFSPTAGNLLVMVLAGSVIGSIASGWTLGTSAVSSKGIEMYYKTAAGSDTATIASNSGSYTQSIDLYEFAAGLAVSSATSGDTASSLTGTNLVMSAKVGGQQGGATSWSTGTVVIDYDSPSNGLYHYALDYLEGVTGTSQALTESTLSIASQLIWAIK